MNFWKFLKAVQNFHDWVICGFYPSPESSVLSCWHGQPGLKPALKKMHHSDIIYILKAEGPLGPWFLSNFVLRAPSGFSGRVKRLLTNEKPAFRALDQSKVSDCCNEDRKEEFHISSRFASSSSPNLSKASSCSMMLKYSRTCCFLSFAIHLTLKVSFSCTIYTIKFLYIYHTDFFHLLQMFFFILPKQFLDAHCQQQWASLGVKFSGKRSRTQSVL